MIIFPCVSFLLSVTLAASTQNVTKPPSWSPFDYEGWAIFSGALLGIILLLFLLALCICFWMCCARCVRKIRAARLRYRIRPSSFLVFGFTDVLESTVLHNMAPRAMLRALQLHDDVTRRLLRRFNGIEVKTIGDAFMVCFTDPIDAVRWATELHRELLYVQWPPGLGRSVDFCRNVRRELKPGESVPEPSAFSQFIWTFFCCGCCRRNPHKESPLLYGGLTLRIGLHCGKSFQVQMNRHSGKPDFLGPTVNQAARVESTARAGETFLSTPLFNRVRGYISKSPDLVWREAGLFLLKGFQGEHRLLTVTHRMLAQRWDSDFLAEAKKMTDGAKQTGIIEKIPGEYSNPLTTDQEYLACQRIRDKMKHSDEVEIEPIEVVQIIQGKNQIQKTPMAVSRVSSDEDDDDEGQIDSRPNLPS